MAKQKKQPTPEDELARMLQEHEAQTNDWNHIREYGCNDPFWEDGTNMNLVRNHIIYSRNQIRELCRVNNMTIPKECNRRLPPEVDPEYVARMDEIRQNAWDAVVRYESDPSFKYLVAVSDKVSGWIREETCLDAVIGYVHNLRTDIANDEYPAMRRHRNPENYLESFRRCAEKIRRHLLSQLQDEV